MQCNGLPKHGALAAAATCVLSAGLCSGATRTQNFDTDPGWDARNNRATSPPIATITQNFGYRPNDNYAGDPNDATGEVGGQITPAGEAAYYGKSITPKTFNDRLTAAGNMYVQTAGHHTSIGFFHTDAVEFGWRNPHQFVLRLQQEGSGNFRAFADYSTSLWRASGARFLDQSNNEVLFPSGQSFQWKIEYYPDANNGGGAYEAIIGNGPFGTYRTGIVNMLPGHKADGATLNRFGLLNTPGKYDDRIGNVWIDDLTINDSPVDTFAQNPGWDTLRNNTTYTSDIVRPRFNFGYSPTHHAGGAGSGEMGGFTWKGDSRTDFSGTRMAYYGDTIAAAGTSLTLSNTLEASGKVSFKRGMTDSAMHVGFFHSQDSVRNSDSQAMVWPENFVGITIEGPSDEGFYFYPTYGTNAEGVGSTSRGESLIHIRPTGHSLDWTLDYDPSANDGNGRITVSLEGDDSWLDLTAEHRSIGAHFNRFGIITSHVDGNGQEVYFDDLTYTILSPEPASLGLLGLGALLAMRRGRSV